MKPIHVLHVLPEEHSLLLQGILSHAQKHFPSGRQRLHIGLVSFHRGFRETADWDGDFSHLGWAWGEAFLNLKKLVRRENIQVIHSYLGRASIWSLIASHFCGVQGVARTFLGKGEKTFSNRFFGKIATGEPSLVSNAGKYFVNPISIPEEIFQEPRTPKSLTPRYVILAETFVPNQIRPPPALTLGFQRIKAQVPQANLYFQNLTADPQDAFFLHQKYENDFVVRFLICNQAKEEDILLRLLQSIVQGIPIVLAGTQPPMPIFLKNLDLNRVSLIPKGISDTLVALFHNMNETLTQVGKMQESIKLQTGFTKHFDLWRFHYDDIFNRIEIPSIGLKPEDIHPGTPAREVFRDQDYFSHLVCPVCKKNLTWEVEELEGGRGTQGLFHCNCGKKYALEKGIPRLKPVSEDSPPPPSTPVGVFWQRHFLESFENGKTWLKSLHSRCQSKPLPVTTGEKIVFLNSSSGGGLAQYTSQGGLGVGVEDCLDRLLMSRQFLRDSDSLRLVHADWHHPPLKPGAFSRVFQPGFEVLQKEPTRNWKMWVELLKKDGEMEILVPVWPFKIPFSNRLFEILREIGSICPPYIIWLIAYCLSFLQIFVLQRRKLELADKTILAGIWFQWLGIKETFFPSEQEIHWWIEDAKLNGIRIEKPKPYLIHIRATAI